MSFVTPKIAFSEAKFLWIISLVQFVNVLDFIMVMPLGPDFAKELGIPLNHLGYVGGAYTMSASVAGLVAALFLDKFDRKVLLLRLLAGLGIATLLATLSWNFTSLVCARVIAGLFGGPLASTSIAMIADLIPAERRGAAMGKFMGAFSIASVLGVPFGLELASLLSWKLPFLVLAITCFLVYFFAHRNLPGNVNVPAMDNLAHRWRRLVVTFRNPLSQVTWSILGIGTLSSFMLIPNIATYVQYNMGYPRSQLGLLYLFGGAFTFVSLRYIGKMVDRVGSTKISTMCTILYVIIVILGFVIYPLIRIPAVVIFIVFMTSMSGRNVATQTITSKVPLPIERASFMSIQAAVTHGGAATGAFLGSALLYQDTSSSMLKGMSGVALTSCVIALFVPLMVSITEKLLARRKTQPEEIPIPPIA